MKKKSIVTCDCNNEATTECKCGSGCQDHSKPKTKPIKTVAVEDLMTSVILNFCENLAELGCPKEEKEADMWYRNLTPSQMRKVSDKLLDIMERDYMRFGKGKK